MAEIKVLVVDYGMENIGSMMGVAKFLNVDHFVSSDRSALARADAIILPGVGAFGAAMNNLLKLNLVDELAKQVLVKKKPFLGVCLGMQLLARESAEQGPSKGLDWIDGKVVKLLPGNGLRVPHVGWNDVHPLKTDLLFERKLPQ
jgi:imidazole glycerol-phosphate synthase subunit HisH